MLVVYIDSSKSEIGQEQRLEPCSSLKTPARWAPHALQGHATFLDSRARAHRCMPPNGHHAEEHARALQRHPESASTHHWMAGMDVMEPKRNAATAQRHGVLKRSDPYARAASPWRGACKDRCSDARLLDRHPTRDLNCCPLFRLAVTRCEHGSPRARGAGSGAAKPGQVVRWLERPLHQRLSKWP